MVMKVQDIMTQNVITIKDTDTVENCAKLLYEHDISSMPVVNEEGDLVGIISEKDLIKRASRIQVPNVIELLGGFIYLNNPNKFMDEVKSAMALIVEEMMTKKVITIKADETMEEAATIIVDKGIKRLPVLDENDKLVGIIARRDIMKHLLFKAQELGKSSS